MKFKLGDIVRALVESDGIDILDMNTPYEVFNFINYGNRVGIKSDKHWYYLKQEELELWTTA